MQQTTMTQAQADALVQQMKAEHKQTNRAGGKVHVSRAYNKTITVTPLNRGQVRVQVVDGCVC